MYQAYLKCILKFKCIFKMDKALRSLSFLKTETKTEVFYIFISLLSLKSNKNHKHEKYEIVYVDDTINRIMLVL